MSRARTLRRTAGVAVLVVAVDQATKAIVRGALERGEERELLPFLDLVNVRNTGVAFGLLADGGALLIVGAAEVLLNLPPGLADRIAARCVLGPLTEGEAGTYIHGRLAAAGAKESLFDPPALRALYIAADGLPRRLNRLADLALLIAYAREQDRPDVETVAIAERETDYAGLAA